MFSANQQPSKPLKAETWTLTGTRNPLTQPWTQASERAIIVTISFLFCFAMFTKYVKWRHTFK